MSQKRILITGASGLVGRSLAQYLHEKGYAISLLSRKKSHKPSIFQSYIWNIGTSHIDEEAISTADYIIHLAGENVGEREWTERRKQAILESRTRSTNLLFEKLKTIPNQVKGFVSASAIGLYGMDLAETEVMEDSPVGEDFLANVTIEWEKSIDQIAELGKKVAKLRIGVVLDRAGGALAKMLEPIKFWVGAPLGTGTQYISWIHPSDLCRMFEYAISKDLEGAYNAVAPKPVTNAELTQALAKMLDKPLFLPNIPEFALRLALGEMADIALLGKNVSCQKIQSAGFEFQYPDLQSALNDLFQKK